MNVTLFTVSYHLWRPGGPWATQHPATPEPAQGRGLDQAPGTRNRTSGCDREASGPDSASRSCSTSVQSVLQLPWLLEAGTFRALGLPLSAHTHSGWPAAATELSVVSSEPRQDPCPGRRQAHETAVGLAGPPPRKEIGTRENVVGLDSGGTSGQKPACQCRKLKRRGFDPWVEKIPWSRAWQPPPVSLPGEFHGQRSPGGLQPTGSQGVRHDWVHACTHRVCAPSLRDSYTHTAETGRALIQQLGSRTSAHSTQNPRTANTHPGGAQARIPQAMEPVRFPFSPLKC